MIYQSLVGFCLIFWNIFSTYAWLTLSWLSRLITNDVYQIDFRVKKSKKACTKGYTMPLKPLNFGLLTPQCYWDFLGQKEESTLINKNVKLNFFPLQNSILQNLLMAMIRVWNFAVCCQIWWLFTFSCHSYSCPKWTVLGDIPVIDTWSHGSLRSQEGDFCCFVILFIWHP